MFIRRFNEKGIEKITDVYQLIKESKQPDIPDSLISSEEYTQIVDGNIEIDYIDYSSKEDLIKYISSKVNLLKEDDITYDVGIWNWLSAFYFETLCPQKNGSRKVGSLDRHLLNVTDWRRYYRHLLACPFRLYKELDDKAKIYLSGKPDIHGDLLEQLASSQEIATNPGIIEAATILYWDPDKQKLKRGSRSKKKAGNVRRFAREIIPQFQMTFDLNTMNGQEIVELLPPEFEEWVS